MENSEQLNRRNGHRDVGVQDDTTIDIPGYTSPDPRIIRKRISKVKICMAILILGVLTVIFVNIPRGFRNSIIFGDEQYPYGDPLLGTVQDGILVKNEYDFIAVADRDEYAYRKDVNKWESVLISGTIRYEDGEYKIVRIDRFPLFGMMNEGTEKGIHRGMELSALKRFNSKLYTCCDRTGIVYEILSKTVEEIEDSTEQKVPEKEYVLIPRYILANGDGYSEKGFKCEWITVKDDVMYIGSIGKPWTTTKGEITGYGPMYVKQISKEGRIKHSDWRNVYTSIQSQFGEVVSEEGYIVVEAVEFNPVLNSWFVFPRRISTDKYDSETEPYYGSNSFVKLSDNLKRPRAVDTKLKKKQGIGFSAVKFIPGKPKLMVTLRTHEPYHDTEIEDNKIPAWKTYISIISVNGEVMMPETLLANEKLEGIELARRRRRGKEPLVKDIEVST